MADDITPGTGKLGGSRSLQASDPGPQYWRRNPSAPGYYIRRAILEEDPNPIGEGEIGTPLILVAFYRQTISVEKTVRTMMSVGACSRRKVFHRLLSCPRVQAPQPSSTTIP